MRSSAIAVDLEPREGTGSLPYAGAWSLRIANSSAPVRVLLRVSPEHQPGEDATALPSDTVSPGPYRWQRTQCLAVTCSMPGMSWRQTSITNGQREANGQPGGGLTSDG